ncbi:MAG: histidine kinase [Chloroflexota bacterium]|nr:MAG: histidine kinase [Chloroflexota bacterium]
MNPRCHIGTSGWVYPHWREVFYPPDLPQSRWFDYYSQHFATVEINNSFYRLPTETTFDRWQAQAPPGFTYAVKANRFLTHLKRLKEVAEPLERFLSRARRLSDTLGPILWQLPPNRHADPVRLETFAALLPTDVTNVFEFRDPSWFVPPVREILERFRLSFCVFDMPNLSCPLWVTSPVVYVRFHGAERTYAGRYGRARLESWAERSRQWLAEGRTVFAYFNNDAFGHAIEDARLLRELVAA